MSITDELREWLENAYSYGTGENLFKKNYRPWFGWKLVLEPMLDRIDAEHERLMQEQPFTIDMVPITDENMAKHGWVRLPVDAEGVPIHVGDKMEFCAFDIEHPVIRTVDGIGKDVFFAWCGERGYQQHDAKRYRHYTPPTVEDVLEEFAQMYIACNDKGTIAEYAKRLRLAGDGE